VEQQGLYYRFLCRCRITDGLPYRLYVRCGNKREKIGILVPVADGFGLDSKIAAKRFGEGDMNFFLTAKDEVYPGKFFPISPEEPFGYLSRLRNSFLAIQNGCPGAVEKQL